MPSKKAAGNVYGKLVLFLRRVEAIAMLGAEYDVLEQLDEGASYCMFPTVRCKSDN